MMSLLSEPAGSLALVFALALVAPLLADKIRVPTLTFLALAGVFAAPMGFDPAQDILGAFGRAGMLYVFFAAGAELDPGRILRGDRLSRAPARIFAPFAFVLPFAAGTAAGYYLLGLALPSSALVGAALAAFTTSPFAAVEKLGLSRRKAASAAAGAELLADSAAVALLAVVARVSSPLDPRTPLVAALLTAAWVLVSAIVLPRAAKLFFRAVKPEGTVEFIFVLTLGFACALGAQLAGIEPAAGAFLAGILLRRFLPEASVVNRRLRFVGDALFLPFLLVYAGALADPISLAGDAASLGMVGLILAIGLSLPWIASMAASLLLRLARSERQLLWGLSASRAAPALALALAGFELGLVDRAVLGGLLLLVLVSSALGDIITRAAGAKLAASGTGGAERLRILPERILVAVSNPSSIRGLVDLAFLLRGAGNNEPVFPVAVVPESENREAELAAAENHLAQALVQGVAAGVPVVPSARVSVNAPDGILKAARENRASAVLIGWNKAPKLSHAFFGSVIEQVVLGTNELVIVSRLTRPLSELSRIALVLPATIERHPGFDRALAALGSLAAQTGAKLTAYTLAGGAREARAALSSVESRGAARIVEIESWKDFPEAAKAPGPELAFVLFVARPGRAAWHPAVERLPHRLGEDFPETPLFIFYLPEPERPADEAPEAAELSASGATGLAVPAGLGTAAATDGHRDLLDRAIEAGRVRPAMPETAIADGLREMLRPEFGQDRKAFGKLVNLFTQMAQSGPIELEPGVLLLHAHVEEAAQTMVFFGARPEGFRLVALEESVRLIVLLCAPVGQSPEEHLATLGEIARLFKDGRVEERLGV